MSYENKGSMTAVAVVTHVPDRSGNFVIEAVDDPAVVIEAAWAYLNTFGGGTLILKGAGQTWTFETTCDSQGDDVTVIGDLSLLLRAMNDLNADVFFVTHDRVSFYRLRIDGNDTNQSGGDDDTNGIQFNTCDHGRVRDCDIQNSFSCNIRIEWGTDHFWVDGCYLAGAHFGLFVQGAGGTDPTRVDITNCHVNVADGTPGFTGTGFFVQQVSYARVKGCFTENCVDSGIEFNNVTGGVIEGTQHYNNAKGIITRNCYDITISNNTVHSTTGATGDSPGIHVWGDTACYNISVVGNSIYDAADYGIFVDAVGGTCYSITVSGNTIKDSDEDGIYVEGDDNTLDAFDITITGNSVYNSGDIGIFLENVKRVVCSSNVVYSSGEMGIRVNNNINATLEDSGIVIMGNSVIGGADRGIEVECTGGQIMEGLVIASNCCSDNANHNFTLQRIEYSSITGNVAMNSGAGWGIIMTGSDWNTITANVMNGNSSGDTVSGEGVNSKLAHNIGDATHDP